MTRTKNLLEAFSSTNEKGGDSVLLTFKDVHTATDLDEIDAMLARKGIYGMPDFNDLTITINSEDLKEAKKILKFYIKDVKNLRRKL